MKKIAIDIVESEFATKKDKGGNPYLGHLYRVSENAKIYYEGFNLEKLEIIGLLHDLLEDCKGWNKKRLKKIFKDDVIVDSVDLLTKRDGLDYDQYISNIAKNRFARAVKLADLCDNMDLSRLKVVTEKDLARIEKYKKSYFYLLTS